MLQLGECLIKDTFFCVYLFNIFLDNDHFYHIHYCDNSIVLLVSVPQYQSLCHRHVHDHFSDASKHRDAHPNLEESVHGKEDEGALQMRMVGPQYEPDSPPPLSSQLADAACGLRPSANTVLYQTSS